MRKLIVVINGAGGVGKDTMIGFVEKRYMVWNCSSIEPIKNAAEFLGWNISMKDDRSRKFLSDLKMLSTEYNDCPFHHIVDRAKIFLECFGHGDVLFVHVREPKEIMKFVNAVSSSFGVKPITLLIRRDAVVHEYGNMADDNVENYSYDFIYNNDKPLDEAEEDFMRFFEENIMGEEKK